MRVLWSNGHKRITLIQGAFATLKWRSYILMRGDFFVCMILVSVMHYFFTAIYGDITGKGIKQT